MKQDNEQRTIRRASADDLDTIKTLIAAGKRKMIASGNLKQWTDNRPSIDQLKQDIANGDSYLVMQGSGEAAQAIATFAFIAGPDPTYTVIDGGAWLNDAPYFVLHRVASAEDVHGVMETIISFCARQTANIRIDTHADNVLMQTTLKRLGFTYCGIIYLEGGDERWAYQKVFA